MPELDRIADSCQDLLKPKSPQKGLVVANHKSYIPDDWNTHQPLGVMGNRDYVHLRLALRGPHFFMILVLRKFPFLILKAWGNKQMNLGIYQMFEIK